MQPDYTKTISNLRLHVIALQAAIRYLEKPQRKIPAGTAVQSRTAPTTAEIDRVFRTGGRSKVAPRRARRTATSQTQAR